MWTEKARSWRKNKKRAVSPIIATILLVAITVVLAAVLYILISGLTKGPGNTPLGTAFGWGTASNITSTAAVTGCTTGKSCYSLEIASAGGGITTSALGFSLRSATGAVVPFPPGFAVSLLSVNGLVLDSWNSTHSTWTSTVALSAGQTIVFGMGAGGLFGDTILAVGTGSYSGTVQSAALN